MTTFHRRNHRSPQHKHIIPGVIRTTGMLSIPAFFLLSLLSFQASSSITYDLSDVRLYRETGGEFQEVWAPKSGRVSVTCDGKIIRCYDTDGDGRTDDIDNDDDNDGVLDSEDAFPTDPFRTTDTDEDGLDDLKEDPFPGDHDNDGLVDSIDDDDDGDGIPDSDDPSLYDRDNDGYSDREDDFPDDAAEHRDTDGDQIGNNADEDDDGDGVNDLLDGDDDNDGIPDEIDDSEDKLHEAKFEVNKTFGSPESDSDADGKTDGIDDDNDGIDDDGDGLIDEDDNDEDNDGVPDDVDKFIHDARRYQDDDNDGLDDYIDDPSPNDHDNDGLTDDVDDDDDNDGIPDDVDPMPEDHDNDGISDRYDRDADNDGIRDDLDDDDDNDGIPDALDTDDDGDNVPDENDPDPVPTRDTDPDANKIDLLFTVNDADGDGIPDDIDDDDDNDGYKDEDDDKPLDATEYRDTDGDGLGNNKDDDDDNDGKKDGKDSNDPDADDDDDGDGIKNDEDDDEKRGPGSQTKSPTVITVKETISNQTGFIYDTYMIEFGFGLGGEFNQFDLADIQAGKAATFVDDLLTVNLYGGVYDSFVFNPNLTSLTLFSSTGGLQPGEDFMVSFSFYAPQSLTEFTLRQMPGEIVDEPENLLLVLAGLLMLFASRSRRRYAATGKRER